MANEKSLVTNGIKLLGETFVLPGSSLIMDGQIKQGLVHSVAGLAAIAVLGPVAGPIARLLVGANSYSRSVANQNLWEVMSEREGEDEENIPADEKPAGLKARRHAAEPKE